MPPPTPPIDAQSSEPRTPEPTTSPQRDPRLDLLRGLCVGKMLFSHLGWDRLAIHFPIGWATAAEGFFLLSGATLGTVARRYDATGRAGALRRRLVLRALWLYGINLLLLAVARGLAVAPPFRPGALERRWRRVPELVSWLSFDQPLALHVLPRYALFLLGAALLLPLLRSRAGSIALAVSSGALWLAHRESGLFLPWLESRRALFPTASWQLLFTAGLLLAYRFGGRQEARARWRWLGPAAAAASLVFVAAANGGMAWALRLAEPQQLERWLERAGLGPLRLLNVAVVAVCAWWLVSRWREPLLRATGWLLLPLGRNALPAFLLHLPLIWVGLALSVPESYPSLRRLYAVAALAAIALVVRWPSVRRVLSPV